MNKETIIQFAKKYLQEKGIEFVGPGELGFINKHNQEVIFLDPLIFDSNVAIVDPGDIRVLVNVKTKQVTLIDQM